MRERIAAGNWKMNTELDGAVGLAKAVAEGSAGALAKSATRSEAKVVLFPPFPFLWPVVEALRGTAVETGGQNCHAEKSGAFTGEVSGPAIRSTGARWILAGHSERRQLFGESDDTVAAKVLSAYAADLRPVLCVGETLEEREGGWTMSVIARQLNKVLNRLRPDQLETLVVAYEPVWAIGTGKNATPAQANEVHAAIRDIVAGRFDRGAAERLPVLYGGSVKPDNAEALMAQSEIDGALVGGASLKADDFLKIVRAVAR